MIAGRCPICDRRFELPRIEAGSPFPFCSERCRLLDLGRWLDGRYVIPGKPAATDDEAPDRSQTEPGVDDDE
jgi:endogenous inhibitor of DNA gyrase (YacG/DUF329 family)